MDIVKSNIANALTSAAKDHVLGVANDIYDEALEKYQSEINAEFNDKSDIIKNIKTRLDAFLLSNDLSWNNLSLIMQSIGAINENGKHINDINTKLNNLGANYKNLYAVAKTLHDFIESQDLADTTINRWKELEAFLTGITDTETLTGLLEELKTSLESKITEGASKVKDVDGVSLILDKNGLAKFNYSDEENGTQITTVDNNVSYGPIRTKFYHNLRNQFAVDNKVFVYSGNRELQPNAINLVQEKALYKHITELNQIIPDVKVIKITPDGPNQELLDYINDNGDITKLICIYNHRDIYPYLLTITLVEENNLKTSIFQYNQENNWFNYLNVDRTTGVCNIITIKITDSQIININGSKIVDNSISGNKLTEDVQRQIGELPTIKTNINKNTTAITNLTNTINEFIGSEDTDNNYNKLLNLLGVTADAAQLTELTTKFNELGEEYSTVYKVAKTVHDFLNDIDVSDTTINRWTEIKNFLAGITDDKDLLGIINDSIRTNNENYYTKEEIDNITATLETNGFKIIRFTLGTTTNCQSTIDLYNDNPKLFNKIIGIFEDISTGVTKYYISCIYKKDNTDKLYSHPFYQYTVNNKGLYSLYYFTVIPTMCGLESAKIDGTNIYNHTIPETALSNNILTKLNDSVKIFEIGNENTALINYINENGYDKVLIKYSTNDANYLLPLVNNRKTAIFLQFNTSVSYISFTDTNYNINKCQIHASYISDNTIDETKLTENLRNKLLTTSSIATDEELTEILNNI